MRNKSFRGLRFLNEQFLVINPEVDYTHFCDFEPFFSLKFFP